MKEGFFKVDGPFLSLTSPVPVTFARFLACTFRKFWSTSTLKIFCRCSYIFGITSYPLIDKWFPLLALKHAPKHNSWGLNGTNYWGLLIVEYLQANKFKERPNLTLYLKFPGFFCWMIHHVSIYFPRKTVFHCLPREKISFFQQKNTIFPDNTRKIMCRHGTFRKDHIFRKFEENIIFPCTF